MMMSRNRPAAKDRIKQDATNETNLKLELQIMRLHTKLDQLSTAFEKTQNQNPEIRKG